MGDRTTGMRRRGFTAPEATMVVLLLMLATAAVMAANRIARDRARDVQCRSNLQQLALAIRLYAADHDHRVPPGPKDWDAVFPYVRNNGVLLCPLGPTARRRTKWVCTGFG
jgi:type II secretory pathway pseudopilin PulG